MIQFLLKRKKLNTARVPFLSLKKLLIPVAFTIPLNLQQNALKFKALYKLIRGAARERSDRRYDM